MDFEFGCEECGTENEDLFDTILDNKPTRLCERCARASNALILNEERGKMREKWNVRYKKQDQTYKEETPVSLNGLWERYKQKMGERNTLEKQKKMAVLEERKFLEDLEKQKKLENKEIVQAIESDFNPEEKIEEEKSFNEEASKKIDIKGFFKQTFKFLKGKEKKEETGDIPEMVPDMIEPLEERKDEN